MKLIQNKFGSGELLDAEDLKGDIYATCTACMGIYSEFLSWANANSKRISTYIPYADNIIVLSCQVTDLAVLNDIRHLESLMQSFPNKKFFIGGCLAKRFDIALPNGVQRLNNIDSDNTQIDNFDLVHYEKPFWVKNFKDNDHELGNGHLFRKMYPLRIGVGCTGNCSYCSIRVTRGKYKEIGFDLDQFLNNANVVIIADSPTVEQIETCCYVSSDNNKQISIRNIEPKIVKKTATSLLHLAQRGLLKHFHSPIQHTDIKALHTMNRKYVDVDFVRGFARMLKSIGVITATNIILDYEQFIYTITHSALSQEFDYISWNPYWDGVWDRAKAEKRFMHYIG